MRSPIISNLPGSTTVGTRTPPATHTTFSSTGTPYQTVATHDSIQTEMLQYRQTYETFRPIELEEGVKKFYNNVVMHGILIPLLDSIDKADKMLENALARLGYQLTTIPLQGAENVEEKIN